MNRALLRGGGLIAGPFSDLFPTGQGQGDNLVPLLLEPHDNHALGRAATLLDGVHMGTDQDASLGDQQQVLGAIHNLDAHNGPGLFRYHIVFDAQAASIGNSVLLHGGALAISLFGNGQYRPALSNPGGAHHIVALPQADAPDTNRIPAHGPHIVFVKADRHTIVGCDEDFLVPVGFPDRYQLIPLVQAQGPNAVVAQIFQGLHRQALHRPLAGGHEEVQLLLLPFPVVEHRLNPLPLLHLEDVDHIGALGGLAAFGDLIALLPVNLTSVGKKQDMVVGGGGEHIHHVVLLPGGNALFAHAPFTLDCILAYRGALDVSRLGKGEHALLLLDQVLNVNLILHVLNLGDPVVALRSINSFRGSTFSPIKIVKVSSARTASSSSMRRRVRRSGSIVVSHSSWASISPKPLKRLISTLALGLSPRNSAETRSRSSSEKASRVIFPLVSLNRGGTAE